MTKTVAAYMCAQAHTCTTRIRASQEEGIQPQSPALDVLCCFLDTEAYFLSRVDLDVPSTDTVGSIGVRKTETGQKVFPWHHIAPQPTTDMSDSETAAAPTEAPVPAVCTGIKADLDKCVTEKGGEGCKELMEAFAACVKNAAEGTS
ncbi:hypothetical protein CHARACLAT_017672 [Characodon lateralis]|uniref:Uncharacterized protein n=1 Tax=Characodon lateralis TaxID=208331 RepID=A0ABU7D7P1_9TELE|nr:hypothetical protein [Characodon lateralis]